MSLNSWLVARFARYRFGIGATRRPRLVAAALVALGWAATRPAQAYFDFPPLGVTGAPGESTCVTCHSSFPLNSGNGSVTLSGLPATYVPGQVYQLMVQVAKQGAKRWGFEVSDRKTGTKQPGGTLTITDQNFTQFGAKAGLQYVVHTELGTRQGKPNGLPDGPATFAFAWTAPAAGSGTVDFFAVGNAANFDNTSSGDYIYTTSTSVPEGSTITLAVSPSTKTVATGGSADFTATVTGVAKPRVAWTLRSSDPANPNPGNLGKLVCDDTHDPAICGGTHVLYQAPAAVSATSTVVLTATSLDDLNKVDSASVTISAQIGVEVAPQTANLGPAATQRFSATVTGSTNTGVVWSVQDLTGGNEIPGGNAVLGTVSPDGLYTAPTSLNGPVRVMIRARAQANTGLSGTAVVTVTDNTPPSVRLTQPASGSLLRGTVTLSADASDDASIANVAWFLDDSKSPIGVAPAAPYSLAWDTHGTADGTHTLVARATDGSGNLAATPPVTVTVDNAPPVIARTGLETFTYARGTLRVTPSVSDNLAVAQVVLKIDGATPLPAATTSPYVFAWDTTTVKDGKHTLVVIASDTAGNVTTSDPATIVVDNTPPVASLVKPASGAVVKGVVPATGTATDANFAQYSLQYGSGAAPTSWTAIGSDHLVPVNDGPLGLWDTTSLPSGLYVLRLSTMDQAGNAAVEDHAITVVRFGDVIPDGKITIGDALLALQIAVGTVQPTREQFAAADVYPIRADGTSGDGVVNAVDVLVILRLAIGLPLKIPTPG